MSLVLGLRPTLCLANDQIIDFLPPHEVYGIQAASNEGHPSGPQMMVATCMHVTTCICMRTMCLMQNTCEIWRRWQSEGEMN